MRDPFDDRPANPRGGAALRAPAIAARFYAKAGDRRGPEGHGVQLDGKPVRTPARRVLAAPYPALAEAIAAEWEAQRDKIEPAKMPLTRLANSIIDGVADQPGPVAAEIAKYLASDLLFYRADKPGRTFARAPGRVLGPDSCAGRSDTLGRAFRLTRRRRGAHRAAAGGARRRARRHSRRSVAARALHVVTTLTGSALLALAAAARRFVGRCTRGAPPCRRGLEHGAMGPRRAGARTPRISLRRAAGRGDGAGGIIRSTPAFVWLPRLLDF